MDYFETVKLAFCMYQTILFTGVSLIIHLIGRCRPFPQKNNPDFLPLKKILKNPIVYTKNPVIKQGCFSAADWLLPSLELFEPTELSPFHEMDSTVSQPQQSSFMGKGRAGER